MFTCVLLMFVINNNNVWTTQFLAVWKSIFHTFSKGIKIWNCCFNFQNTKKQLLTYFKGYFSVQFVCSKWKIFTWVLYVQFLWWWLITHVYVSCFARGKNLRGLRINLTIMRRIMSHTQLHIKNMKEWKEEATQSEISKNKTWHINIFSVLFCPEHTLH